MRFRSGLSCAMLASLCVVSSFGQGASPSGLVSVTHPASGDFAQASGATPLPDFFTGTLSASLPIQTPPGRSVQPSLGLIYQSNNQNGPFGVGWTLELPTVERDTRKGLDYS